MGNSYWNNNGRFQKEYEALWKRLVPAEGPAATKAGEALRAMSRIYYRWYNDGDKIERSMPEWEAKGSAARAFCYLHQFQDAASGFTTQDLMDNLIDAYTEEEYAAALEEMADAVIGWAAETPDTPNEDDFLDDRFLWEYDFDIIEDEDDDC